MTTIAYKDGEIAFDSRAVRGETVCNTQVMKKVLAHGYHFFFAGYMSDYDNLINVFLGGEPASKHDNTHAFVVTPEKEILILGFECDGYSRFDTVDPKEIYAIGSGSEYAIGAMDAGCSAKDAVKIACGRDLYSGGRIRTFKI